MPPKLPGLIEPNRSIPRLSRILFADAAATVVGSLTGTSTVTNYVESTAGVAAGGRSGVTAIVTGLLFVAAIGAAPFAGMVPAAATSPALIPGWVYDAHGHRRDRLARFARRPSCFPYAGSHTIHIFDCLRHHCLAVLHAATCKIRPRDWLLYVLAALFVVRFIYVSPSTD